MAIQIRRGTNAGWEASKSNIVVGEPAVTTDTERAFIGTGGGLYMELANLERIAPAYDLSVEYATGDIVSWQGELYKALAPTSGAFNVSYWDKMTFAEILKDFNEHKYDGYELNTIENVEIASFDNGASGIAVKDLQVDITAQQDLHGYSHPWAGGAGKNLLHVDVSSTTVNGITFTVHSDGTITCNGTATGTVYLLVKQYALSVSAGTYTISLGINSADIRLYNDNHGLDSYYTPTATFDSATSFPIYLRVTNGKTLNNVLVKPMIERGSSATDFEPYSNICPIDGYDEVVVNVAGKNLYIGSPSFDGYVDRSYYTLSSETYNGHEVIQKTSTWYGAYKEVPVLAGKTYTFSAMVKVSSAVNVYIYDVDDARLSYQYVSANTWTRVQATFTASKSRLEHLRVEIGAANTTIYLSEYQLELGSTATAYEPYNGNTYTTDLDGTYYGGTLDVTTGVLTVTHKAVDLGSLSWGLADATNNIFASLINDIVVPASSADRNKGIKSSIYPPSVAVTINANMDNHSMLTASSYLYIRDTFYNDATAFKTAVTGQTLMYELATPQTVQLTEQEAETVYKNNNVWANSGDIKVLVYRMTRH